MPGKEDKVDAIPATEVEVDNNARNYTSILTTKLSRLSKISRYL